MNVSELAKQLGTTTQEVLGVLKSLRLKAKDGKQEVSAALISVVKTEWVKKGGTIKPVESPEKAPEKVASVVQEKIEPEQVTKAQEAAPVKKSTKAVSKEKKELKKSPAKPKEAAKEVSKQRMRMSNEPVITLKPLVRKKKKMIGRDGTSPSGPERTDLGVASGDAGTTASDVSGAAAVGQTLSSLSSEETASLQEIELKVPISVKDFAGKLQQKPSVILKELMKMGILANINQNIDADLAEKLCVHFGFKLGMVKTQEEQIIEFHKKEQEDPKFLKPRAPVVTFMGHVDHGKTSLLDRVRKSRLTDKEHGGITQHIGAYSVQIQKGRITFLDTPGHEAFTAMRARGAHITDLVVLVVAADEGIMPQTMEALDHAKAAEVPIVVALNKIDHRNANVDRVKKQLMEIGLTPEDWGGKTIVVGVSALTGEGVDKLLELILLEAELLELKANFEKRASGIVIEAHMSQGRGVVSSLIVQSGVLKEGDIIVVGHCYGKIKAMFNDYNEPLKEAGPSMPVEILGLSAAPEAGEEFYVVEDEKQAREISSQRFEQIKNEKLNSTRKITLEDISVQIQMGKIRELNVVIKADVQGSLEALKDSLEKIPNEKIKLKCIHLGLGDVNASDVLLAVASKAIIMAFHVGIDSRARQELEKEPVDVRQYRIIYDAVNDMRNALEGLLEAKTYKKFLSRLEIRQVFKLSKSGIVAGCYVTKGRLHRKAMIDILREQKVIYSGQIGSLKRFKDDVREVNEGMECGVTIGGFDKIEPGDIIEAYELESVAQKL